MKLNGKMGSCHLASIRKRIEEWGCSLAYFSYNMLPCLAAALNCKTAVEIHNIIHLREAQFKVFHRNPPMRSSREAELADLASYDHVICISIDDQSYLQGQGLNTAQYIPPSIDFMETPRSGSDSTGGIACSRSIPNIDGFHCAFESMSRLSRLVLAGPICDYAKANFQLSDKIKMLGLVKHLSEFYQEIDVALAPARFGGGLKIKVLEALAHGRPILAHSHNIIGYPKGIEAFVHVENDFLKWDDELIQEVASVNVQHLRDYVQTFFSEQNVSKMVINLFG